MASPVAKQRVYLGYAGCALAVLIIGGLSSVRSFRSIDLLFYDFLAEVRAELHPPRRGLNSVVLVLVDENTQSELDLPWPWPRSTYVELIDNINQGGAKAIGFDLLFLDKGDTEEDAALAETLQRHRNVVIGAKLETSDRRLAGRDIALGQTRLLLPIFRDEAKVGLVNLPFDDDQVVRRFLPTFDIFDRTYYSFAMAVFRAGEGRFPIVAPEGEHGIDFLGPGGTFPSVSASSVVTGKIFEENPNIFHNRIVLFGVILSEAKELFSTPVSKGDTLCPGVEIHANIIASMLDESYLNTMPRFPQVLLAAVIAFVAGYLAMFRSGKVVLIFYALMTLAILCIAIPFMVYEGISFDITYPLLAMPFGYILAGLPARQPMVLNTQIGPYQLLGELGRGGMAVVYKARHPKSKEVVALKQMLPEYAADEQALQRFMREMDLLQQLNHPSIVRIIDAGEVGGMAYYAMEYISGKSLEDVLQEQYRLSANEVRRTCEGVARALDQAHKLGVVHRDLKPSNIMLTSTGSPKLTDFGIACKSDAPHLTQVGMLIGTPQYMSPEQVRGEDVTPSSDIYSFGATMYHLLTGAPPFPWPETNRILRSHLDDTPIDVRQKNSSIDEAMAVLVMACLAKKPADRPDNMSTVAFALDPYASMTATDLSPVTGLQTQVTQAGTAIVEQPENESWQESRTISMDPNKSQPPKPPLSDDSQAES